MTNESAEARLREALERIVEIDRGYVIPSDNHDPKRIIKDGRRKGYNTLYLGECGYIAQQALSAGADEATKSEPPHWHEVEMMRLIDLLRSEEGDSVTILCDNPDFNGQPDCAVVCNGAWTDWEDRRFAQDTLLDALSAAMIEYKRPREAKESEGLRCRSLPSGESNLSVTTGYGPSDPPDRREIVARTLCKRRGIDPDWPVGVSKDGYRQEPATKHIPAWKWHHSADADAILAALDGGM